MTEGDFDKLLKRLHAINQKRQKSAAIRKKKKTPAEVPMDSQTRLRKLTDTFDLLPPILDVGHHVEIMLNNSVVRGTFSSLRYELDHYWMEIKDGDGSVYINSSNIQFIKVLNEAG